MGNRLFVGNLSFSTTDEGLRGAFPGATSAKVITDRESGRSRGFGFVEFGTDEEAARAIQECDGRDLDGRTIRVNEAEQKSRGGGGGGHGGGGHGGDHGGGGRSGKGSRRRRSDDDRY
jgi:cold-inducible RNA-binding protein